MTEPADGQRDTSADSTEKRPKRKYRKRPCANWRTLIFTPEGGDPSQAIRFRDKGFMHLCEQLCDGKLKGYTVDDTKGIMRQQHCLAIKWTDFRKAFYKYRDRLPAEKPSVFQGEYYPPEHSIKLRKRLLAAALREYITPDSLAKDLLDWMSVGREEDIRTFVLAIMYGVGWLKDTPRTIEAASTKPIQRTTGHIVIFG